MGFNVSFSKKNTERFYLPGQEIKFSRGMISQKIFASDGDNVMVCRTRIWLAMLLFAACYCVLAARVTYVCLGHGISIDTPNYSLNILFANDSKSPS